MPDVDPCQNPHLTAAQLKEYNCVDISVNSLKSVYRTVSHPVVSMFIALVLISISVWTVFDPLPYDWLNKTIWIGSAAVIAVLYAPSVFRALFD